MKFLDLLAKLGILRYGAKKATWTSAKDMPTEMLMDNVYDAKRDLVTGGAKAVPGDSVDRYCQQCGKPVSGSGKFCTKCGKAVA